MTEIIPAIMPKSYADLKDNLSQVSGIAPFVQIDVMDGSFVTNRTWPYQKAGSGHAGQPADPDFEKILKEEDAFPFWEEVDFEADLMVSDPLAVAHEWISAGAKRIIVHFESVSDPKAVIEQLRRELPPRDSVVYTEIGIAINLDTANEKLESLLLPGSNNAEPLADFVQFMGIAKIGYQGQPFDERVLTKISALRAAHPGVTISVDGSVNLDTAPKLIAAGANRLAIGSAIFSKQNVEEAIQEFFQIAETGQ